LLPGEPCKNTPARCLAGTECTAAGCTEKLAPRGTPCLLEDLCDPIRNLHCNLVSGLCEPWAPAVPAGAPCGTVIPEGSTLTCTPEATCFGPAYDRRVCIPRGGEGEPCDPAAGHDCRLPAVCAGGTCVTPVVVTGGLYQPAACR
jgi:hypothetical protein